MKRIAVILPTYQGDRFIQQQLDSVFSQKGVELEVFVRDDGSEDESLEILSKYDVRLITQRFGERLGTSLSLWTILSNLDLNHFDYIALCDQDDIWEPNHLFLSVSSLESIKNSFRLSFPNYGLINANGIEFSEIKVYRNVDYMRNSPVQNLAMGCGVVFSVELGRVLKQIPAHVYTKIYFDWILYFIASQIGVVVHTHSKTVFYRQHDNNQTGISRTAFRRVLNFSKTIRNYRESWPGFVAILKLLEQETFVSINKSLVNFLARDSRNIFMLVFDMTRGLLPRRLSRFETLLIQILVILKVI